MSRKRHKSEVFEDLPDLCGPREKASRVDTTLKNRIIAVVDTLETEYHKLQLLSAMFPRELASVLSPIWSLERPQISLQRVENAFLPIKIARLLRRRRILQAS